MKNILRKVIAVLLLFVVGISYLSFTSGAEDIEGYVQPKNENIIYKQGRPTGQMYVVNPKIYENK